MTLKHRLWEALRFSASRSVITSAEEQAILAAFPETIDAARGLPFSHDQRAQAAVLADLPDSVAQEAGSFYETHGSLHKDCLKRDCMAEAWAHVLRPYLIGLRDHYPPQARPDASQADSNIRRRIMSTSQNAPEAGATELLPCPFCGGESAISQTGPKELTLRCVGVQPSGLLGCGPLYRQKVKHHSLEWLSAAMAETWNRRATSPSPPPGVGEQGSWWGSPQHERQRMLDRIDELEHALKAANLVMKLLEWEPYPNPVFAGPDVAIAHVEFRHFYQAQRDPNGPGFMVYLTPQFGTLWWESKGHATIDEAKSAAQADFERRIRSALVPSSLLKEAEEALTDARKWLNGQPDRSTCKAEFLNDLLENIDAVLARLGAAP